MTLEIQLHEHVIQGSKELPITFDFRYLPNSKPKPVIIFCHGFKGFKDWGHWNLIANEFAKKGYVFVKFNYSHNGINHKNLSEITDMESFKQNNYNLELDDLGIIIEAVYSEQINIPSNEIQSDDIILIGHSRSGPIVLTKAIEDSRIQQVITWGGVADFGYFWKNNPLLVQQWEKDGAYKVVNSRTNQELELGYQFYETVVSNQDRYNLQKHVQKSDFPILVIHGTADSAVSFLTALEMQSWSENVLIYLIDEADHVFGGYHPYKEEQLPEHSKELIRASIEFLEDSI